ncbi:hypothetical protein [Actinomadura luzonensis]|uniref:hypothetical protein n=1 Tax=Actinomadura luzonensis TaxID=2805427 RepID=UPI00267731D6|nr:hypothetical protein [Actinomadura luzonensis]
MPTAREIAGRSGLDVDALVEALSAAARAELRALYRYTVLSSGPLAFAGEGLRQVLEDIRGEVRRHFEALARRVCELEGAFPASAGRFLGEAGDAVLEELLSGGRDPAAVLAGAAAADAAPYAALCELTEGRDVWTYELVAAVRHEKLEHEAWLREIAGLGPPGRFQRGFRGRSPYLSRLPGPQGA